MGFPQEAVNELLRVIGLTTVNRVDLTDPATFDAHATLVSADKALQEKGYWFNRDYTYTLSKNADGFIMQPADMLSCEFPTNNYTFRNGKVYDRTAQSYIHTEDIVVNQLVTLIDYESCPEVYKQALLAEGKLTHYIDNDDGSAKIRDLTNKRDTREFRLRQENLKKQRVSALNAQYANRLLGGMGRNPIAAQFADVSGGYQWLLNQ